jgi:dienelactone hydrolase
MALPAACTNAVARLHFPLVAGFLNFMTPALDRFHDSRAHRGLATDAARRRRICAQIAAGAALGLALSGNTVSAENSNPQSNTAGFGTQLVKPKQIGPWTISGWNNDNGPYCIAERQLPGAAGRGATLHYVLVRTRIGYRLVLASTDWELKSGTSFPVELIANPVLRSDASALVLGENMVGIDLGSDRQLMQRLAMAPQIEVKTAQRTFKLPVDVFDRAVAASDTCFDAIKQPSNPFAAPRAAPKQPGTTPQASPKQPEAAPKPPPASLPPKVLAPPATKQRDSSPPAASSTNVGRDTELAEERTFLTARSSKGSYRLEALVVRPAKADGRLPIALITHGQNSKSDENQQMHADFMAPQARDLAMRGWLAVAVMRRGYGNSDGLPGVARGKAHMSCENGDLARGFDVEAEDLNAALKAVAARPDADGSRAIAIGQSLGGGAVLALAARQPAGLLGVVNVSGGVWRAQEDGVCDHDALVAAMANLGSRTRIVSLWLYAQNDSLFPPDIVNRMRDAYAKAGGRADLRMLPPVLHDGHNLFADFTGRGYWLRALDGYLRTQVLPNANAARAERLMRAAKAPTNMRVHVENYFSAPMPRVLVVSQRGATYWSAKPNDLEGARQQALTNCREKSGAECTVAMENNDLVLPAATDPNAANGTTH